LGIGNGLRDFIVFSQAVPQLEDGKQILQQGR
jgi:hypothetical protein